MKIIGMCGNSGSGKGLVSAFFNELGVKSIDTDRVYHELISSNSPCTMELVNEFGTDIFNDPGIDRKKLRDTVFTSRDYLNKLNSITHKHILAEVRQKINEYKHREDIPGVLIDAPLLFESGFDKECDVTVCVIADREIKIDRIMARDNIPREIAIQRINHQISNSELISRCNYFIENNSTKEKLKIEVDKIYNRIFNIQEI